VTVTGDGERVAAFADRHELIRTESVGRQSRAVVRRVENGHPDDPSAMGLSWEPTSLQQLVVAMSLPTQGAAARVPADLEGVAR
jgi:ABC-2 type transport system ATP-binding protein